MLRTERKTNEAEPNLKEFNEWAEKHRGKPFHRDTLKIAWRQLQESGVIHPLKEFTWAIWRVIIRPINLLLEPICKPRKISRILKCDRGLEPSNPSNVADEVSAAAAINSNKSEVVTICEENGITYTKPSAISWATVAQIKAAIALFFHRGGFALDADGFPRVENPQGFLIDAIKKGWINEQENAQVCGAFLNGEVHHDSR